MEYVLTQYKVENNIAVITMNSPKTLNAFDDVMNPELISRLNSAEEDPGVKVVVIEGLEKAFCAGGNLKVFYAKMKENKQDDFDKLVAQAGVIAGMIKRMTKLVITSVSGAAAGAGAGLALSGDFVLAAENAKFSQAFSAVGLATDTGGAYLLSRCIGAQRAMELCISGRAMPAEEAKKLGIVHEIYPKDQLREKTMEFAGKLANGPTKAYAAIKRQIYAAAYKDYDAYLHTTETPLQCASMRTQDFGEALCGFVEKKPFVFSGK